MKINELRIGNFIFDDDGEIAKGIGFKPYENSVRCDEEEGCDISIDIYSADGKVRNGYLIAAPLANPIPLTTEWLERCARKCDGDNLGWDYQINVGALKWKFRWNTEWYSEL